MPCDNDFHPELRTIARFLPRTAVSPRTFRLIRAIESLAQIGGDKGVDVLTLTSGRRVRLHRPPVQDGRAAALLWIHGGGYLIGTPRQDDAVCQRFSRKLGITVAAPEYRRAPEHTYPAALEDWYAALKWLVSLPAVDPTRVAIAGQSAGGGLAAALAFMARERGEVTPVLQNLSYPMLDDRTVSKMPGAPKYRMWNERSNRLGWTSYLGDAVPDVAVPARRNDLSGLPPAWIGIGTNDLFYQEDLAYAERLRAAGVPCHVEVVPGAFHGFDKLAARTSVARAYFESQCAALQQALTP